MCSGNRIQWSEFLSVWFQNDFCHFRKQLVRLSPPEHNRHTENRDKFCESLLQTWKIREAPPHRKWETRKNEKGVLRFLNSSAESGCFSDVSAVENHCSFSGAGLMNGPFRQRSSKQQDTFNYVKFSDVECIPKQTEFSATRPTNNKSVTSASLFVMLFQELWSSSL